MCLFLSHLHGCAVKVGCVRVRLRTGTRAADAVEMNAVLLYVSARDEQKRRSNHQAADDGVSFDGVIHFFGSPLLSHLFVAA